MTICRQLIDRKYWETGQSKYVWTLVNLFSSDIDCCSSTKWKSFCRSGFSNFYYNFMSDKASNHRSSMIRSFGPSYLMRWNIQKDSRTDIANLQSFPQILKSNFEIQKSVLKGTNSNAEKKWTRWWRITHPHRSKRRMINHSNYL